MHKLHEAKAYYDSARVILEERLENSAFDLGRSTGNLGLAYAHLGRVEDARRTVADGEPELGARVDDRHHLKTVAEIYLLIGDYDAAVDLLEQLSGDWLVSAPMLRVDPLWDPLRDHPRFQALLAK